MYTSEDSKTTRSESATLPEKSDEKNSFSLDLYRSRMHVLWYREFHRLRILPEPRSRRPLPDTWIQIWSTENTTYEERQSFTRRAVPEEYAPVKQIFEPLLPPHSHATHNALSGNLGRDKGQTAAQACFSQESYIELRNFRLTSGVHKTRRKTLLCKNDAC